MWRHIISSRLKPVLAWLGEAKYFWLALAVVAIALLLAVRPAASQQLIRLTGLGLQILGILTVVWGISETRALFGHPSVLRKTMAWMGRFPLPRRSKTVHVSASGVAVASASARAHVIHGPGSNPTVEKRLEALEKNITSLHQRISELEQELERSAQRVTDDLRNEQKVRSAEDQQIRQTLEATGTGGVHISAIGALWLLVGVILSTGAPEIANLVQ